MKHLVADTIIVTFGASEISHLVVNLKVLEGKVPEAAGRAVADRGLLLPRVLAGRERPQQEGKPPVGIL